VVPGRALAALALLTVTWGGNWPAMKLALAEMPPWTFRALCLAAGGVGLLLLARARGLSLAIPAADRRRLAWVTLFNIVGWHLCSAYALRLMAGGRASIIGYTMPLWMVLLGRVVLGESVSPGRAFALLLGIAGLAVLIGPDLARVGASPAGPLLMVAAAVSWAIGTLVMKRRPWGMPVTVLAGWQVALGAIPVVPGALLLETPPTSLGVGALAGTLYAVGVGMMLCHFLWFYLLGALPGPVASISVVGVPVFGVLWSAAVLGEPVGWREGVALALVLPAIATVLVGPALLRPRGRAAKG
jgi:drug/metabolite transporter (DMT)-like permease